MTTVACGPSSRSSRRARVRGASRTSGHELPDRVRGQGGLRQETGRGSRLDEVGELFLCVSRDQNEAARGAAGFVDEKPRESTTAAAAEVDVNERDVRAQLGHLPNCFLGRCGNSDDGHAVLLEQGAGCLAEARAVVDDQAAQPHTPQDGRPVSERALQLAAILTAPAAPRGAPSDAGASQHPGKSCSPVGRGQPGMPAGGRLDELARREPPKLETVRVPMPAGACSSRAAKGFTCRAVKGSLDPAARGVRVRRSPDEPGASETSVPCACCQRPGTTWRPG